MPIDEKTGFQVFEAQAGAKFVLQNLDVPVAHIFEENLSLDLSVAQGALNERNLREKSDHFCTFPLIFDDLR